MGRNYSREDNPQLSDLALIWSASESDWRLATFSDVFTLYSESFAHVLLEPDTQYSVPLTGATVVIGVNDNDTHLVVVPAGTIAALTITLPAPANLRDKQTLLVTSTQVVTTLTVNGNGATAVRGAPSAFTANGFFTLKYDLALNVWNRVG